MDKAKNLQDYIFMSRYSKQTGTNKETYEEAVARVMSMHHEHLTSNFLGGTSTRFEEIFGDVYEAYHDQKILGAQRSLQFGGESLLKHYTRMYNCSASYADRVEFFKGVMYVSLCGAGVGYSIHPAHVSKLPEVGPEFTGDVTPVIVVEDSIEGWSDAIDSLMKAFFYGDAIPKFDLSKIRKKGAPITGGFKAPGPEPLQECIEKVTEIMEEARGRQLRPFEVHLIVCTIADAVISGGVRRSALLCMFDPILDKETLYCKTGSLVQKYEQLHRSNNSAIILPDTPYEVYQEVYNAGKIYGEPGFAFVPNIYACFNPCFEICMYPTLLAGDPTKSGFSFCNLSIGNGAKITTEEEFITAMRNAAYIGTMQATYNTFPYLGDITEEIVQRDALIGVGISGMANNPDILFDPAMQRKAAYAVKEANQELADILGINHAARTTCVKPDGNSSQMLNCGSGVHAFHSPMYIRNVQGTDQEQAVQEYKKVNPNAVNPMVGKEKEGHVVISFPIEVADKDAMFKDDLTALDFMDLVKITQNNWVKCGTNLDHPVYDDPICKDFTHNVSNTISRSTKEHDIVEKYLWDNQEHFCGVSFLSSDGGDLDYKQSPYIEVTPAVELAEEYGEAAILAGGLNVDGIKAFSKNNDKVALYDAVDTALTMHTGQATMYSQELDNTPEKVCDVLRKGFDTSGDTLTFAHQASGLMLTDVNSIIAIMEDEKNAKKDWVRRFKKFADRYLKGDLKKTAECLKRISATHTYQELLQSKPVYWEDVEWENNLIDAGSQMGTACAGGKCEI